VQERAGTPFQFKLGFAAFSWHSTQVRWNRCYASESAAFHVLHLTVCVTRKGFDPGELQGVKPGDELAFHVQGTLCRLQLCCAKGNLLATPIGSRDLTTGEKWTWRVPRTARDCIIEYWNASNKAFPYGLVYISGSAPLPTAPAVRPPKLPSTLQLKGSFPVPPTLAAAGTGQRMPPAANPHLHTPERERRRRGIESVHSASPSSRHASPSFAKRIAAAAQQVGSMVLPVPPNSQAAAMGGPVPPPVKRFTGGALPSHASLPLSEAGVHAIISKAGFLHLGAGDDALSSGYHSDGGGSLSSAVSSLSLRSGKSLGDVDDGPMAAFVPTGPLRGEGGGGARGGKFRHLLKSGRAGGFHSQQEGVSMESKGTSPPASSTRPRVQFGAEPVPRPGSASASDSEGGDTGQGGSPDRVAIFRRSSPAGQTHTSDPGMLSTGTGVGVPAVPGLLHHDVVRTDFTAKAADGVPPLPSPNDASTASTSNDTSAGPVDEGALLVAVQAGDLSRCLLLVAAAGEADAVGGGDGGGGQAPAEGVTAGQEGDAVVISVTRRGGFLPQVAAAYPGSTVQWELQAAATAPCHIEFAPGPAASAAMQQVRTAATTAAANAAADVEATRRTQFCSALDDAMFRHFETALRHPLRPAAAGGAAATVQHVLPVDTPAGLYRYVNLMGSARHGQGDAFLRVLPLRAPPAPSGSVNSDIQPRSPIPQIRGRSPAAGRQDASTPGSASKKRNRRGRRRKSRSPAAGRELLLEGDEGGADSQEALPSTGPPQVLSSAALAGGGSVPPKLRKPVTEPAVELTPPLEKCRREEATRREGAVPEPMAPAAAACGQEAARERVAPTASTAAGNTTEPIVEPKIKPKPRRRRHSKPSEVPPGQGSAGAQAAPPAEATPPAPAEVPPSPVLAVSGWDQGAIARMLPQALPQNRLAEEVLPAVSVGAVGGGQRSLQAVRPSWLDTALAAAARDGLVIPMEQHVQRPPSAAYSAAVAGLALRLRDTEGAILAAGQGGVVESVHVYETSPASCGPY